VLTENYKRVLETINEACRRCGRSPEEVTLIAVTKMADLEDLKQAAALGINDFGANRVQDAASQIAVLPRARWHFIGHLQTNKVKDVLPIYRSIQTLDRHSLAKMLQRCAERFERAAEVLIQVNISGEKSKYGLAPEDLPGFLKEISCFDRIKVRGLMTIAPFFDDAEAVRPYFKKLRQLRDRNAKPGVELPELSMGMTNDYRVAIEEGATIVRIGSALFDRAADS